jgi:ribonuclease P protein component
VTFSFKKKHRLLKKKDFQRVFDEHRKLLGKFFKMYYRPGTTPRLGIITSSSYGKAHIRNRFRRHIREAFRHSQHQIPLELIVVPTPIAKNASYKDIFEELALLVQNILSKKKPLEILDPNKKPEETSISTGLL